MQNSRTDKILILGISGMLGHVLFDQISASEDFDVFGTLKNEKKPLAASCSRIIYDVNAFSINSLNDVVNAEKPSVVINCIGIIKQLKESSDPITSIAINALFPHQLAKICERAGARLIHVSTDCVFSGLKGNYNENDISDATDLYGRTKYLGELHQYEHCVTLRTSIIGHEKSTNYGLVEWFLSQKEPIKGFKKAIYTGFPTIELARIIIQYVLPNQNLRGVYQVSSNPISKFELLKLIAQEYGKQIEIDPEETFLCDRSLNSSRFNEATGYQAPSWPELVRSMHNQYQSVHQKTPTQ